MSPTQTEHLDRLLATLLASDATDTRRVSAVALRAVCDAHTLAAPKLAQLVVSHGVEYADDSVIVATSTDSASEHAHAEIVHALTLGAADLADVANELIFHALRAPADTARVALGDLIGAVRRTGRNDVRPLLQGAMDHLADGSELLAWYAGQLLELCIVTGDAPALTADTGWIAVEAARACGDSRAAAEAAFSAASYVDAHESAAFDTAAIELDPAGWGALINARRAFHTDDADLAFEHVRAALAQNAGGASPRLEITARIMLALMQSELGSTRDAITNQRRAEALARQHECWRELIFSITNLAWMLVEGLDLVAARTEHAQLEAVVQREGLVAFASNVATVGAGLAVLFGDRADVAQRLHGLDAPADNADGAYRRARHLEYLAVVDPLAAAPLVAQVSESIERHELVGEELQSLLTACRTAPAGAPWSELVAALGGHATALGQAQALTLLARHRATELDTQLDLALRDALARTAAGGTPLLALARAEVTAVLAGDWQELREIALTWAQNGFTADAAQCRAAAASLAWAAGRSEDATVLAEVAVVALRDLDRTHELAQVHAVRTRNDAHRDWVDTGNMVQLFGADPQVLERVASSVERRTVARRHRFPADHVCIIVSGVATTHLAATDEPTGFARPGMTLGTDRAFDADPAALPETYSVALETCVIDTIPLAVLEAESARSPQFARALAGHVATGMQRELQRAREFVTSRSESRLASLLLDLTDGDPLGGSGGLRVPQHVIGTLIGLSRERVSKAVSKLVSDGIVAQQGQVTVVVDRDALQAIAESR